MSYSQSNEEEIIVNYFGDFKGNLLSIGENDGIHLSNCLKLIENGWSGILVEPSTVAFYSMWQRHGFNDNEKIWCFNAAISDYTGKATFYESGEHLGKGDHSLLSTLNKDETKRWKNEKFKETKCPVWDFETLQKKISSGRSNKYDFINIDAEGEDLKILYQMNLNGLECKCICIEWNSVEFDKYDSYITKFGLKLIHKNQENLLYAL